MKIIRQNKFDQIRSWHNYFEFFEPNRIETNATQLQNRLGNQNFVRHAYEECLQCDLVENIEQNIEKNWRRRLS